MQMSIYLYLAIYYVAAATSVFLCESEAAATATAIVTPRSKLILRFAFQAVMGKWQIRDIERVRLE
jgi:hypothetical protein